MIAKVSLSSLSSRFALSSVPLVRAFFRRNFSAGSASDVPNAAAMITALKGALGATTVEVTDVSGGCGAFFKVLVVAPAFAGVPMIKAHRMVLDTLEKEVGKMHGLTIETRKV